MIFSCELSVILSTQLDQTVARERRVHDPYSIGRGMGLLEDNSSTSYVLVLLMAIDIAVVLLIVVRLYPSFYIQGGEIIRKITESVTI